MRVISPKSCYYSKLKDLKHFIKLTESVCFGPGIVRMACLCLILSRASAGKTQRTACGSMAGGQNNLEASSLLCQSVDADCFLRLSAGTVDSTYLSPLHVLWAFSPQHGGHTAIRLLIWQFSAPQASVAARNTKLYCFLHIASEFMHLYTSASIGFEQVRSSSQIQGEKMQSLPLKQCQIIYACVFYYCGKINIRFAVLTISKCTLQLH